MRVAILTESFLPEVNGVVNSVLRVLDHLVDHGHQVLLLAPDAPGAPKDYRGVPVVGMTSVPLPGYQQVRLCATPQFVLEQTLAEFAPDVVHLASPINVGLRGALAADALGVASVAVYQTDVPGYAARYGVPALEALLWQRVRTTHTTATLTLAPSAASIAQLRGLGVTHLARWGRGVDADLFHPGRRDDALRASLAPAGRRIVGFVGRLAPEKQVADLAALADLPDTTSVVVGDGPERAALEAALPHAVFTGQLRGEELARTVASFDVFVTPGELETFGQTIQEAMASGVPAVAPASGGPVDLIDPSRTGWLYAPGDLAGLRAHVADLLGDDAKRRAMGEAARVAMEPRTWRGVCHQLVGHYRTALDLARERAVRPLVAAGRRV
ncbi:glycosyltransferase family 4 protein [Propioniciclava soli]|uniref:glycosyltransferase family 4 protein n=1 Tax=Propioniciclava soli TaxID=2775081 RepID=UPI001E59FF5F|nr:glycosyltransferase family 1 protein [Propioniciclava soli]